MPLLVLQDGDRILNREFGRIEVAHLPLAEDDRLACAIGDVAYTNRGEIAWAHDREDPRGWGATPRQDRRAHRAEVVVAWEGNGIEGRDAKAAVQCPDGEGRGWAQEATDPGADGRRLRAIVLVVRGGDAEIQVAVDRAPLEGSQDVGVGAPVAPT